MPQTKRYSCLLSFPLCWDKWEREILDSWSLASEVQFADWTRWVGLVVDMQFLPDYRVDLQCPVPTTEPSSMDP